GRMPACIWLQEYEADFVRHHLGPLFRKGGVSTKIWETEMYWTEGGPDYTDPDYARNAADWGKTFAEILRNCCRSITTWNLALDENGRPNIGPFSCGGLVTIHSQSQAISYSGQFWALAHYSRFIRRGARRFDSQSAAADLYHAGFANPDGRHVLVLSNPGAARTCEVRTSNLTARVALSKNSVTTMEWTGA